MSLSVLDVTTGDVVTVPLEDAGKEMVKSVIPNIEKELGRVGGLSEGNEVMVTQIVRAEGCRECNPDETVDYYLIDGCGWLVKTIVKKPLRQDRPGMVTISMPSKSTSIEVTGNLTVMGLKIKIESKEGIPRLQQCLVVNWSEMDDNRTLEEHCIDSEQTIHLSRRFNRETMVKKPLCQDHVLVRTPSCKIVPIRVTENLTVRDLKARIQDQEGFPSDRQSLIVHGVRMEDDWTLEECDLEADVFIDLVLHLQVVNFSLVKKPLCQDHVMVMTNTGETIRIKVTENLTVMDLKARIQRKVGIPPDDQRLLVHGVIMMNDDRTLEEYNGLEPDGIVHLVLRLTGGGPCPVGGVEFADVSSADSLKRKDWSKSAPKWRVACPGLCLEGVCQNEKCSANGKRVIMNHGNCEFDLIEDQHKCKCPICREQVIPTTCGFNNCRWKWVGRKIEDQTQRPVTIRADWKVADNAYHYFDETKSGTANWLRLKITTEQVSDDHIICAICLCGAWVPAETDTLPCGHTFHGKCIGEWMKQSRTCPLCRANSVMTPFMRKAAGL